MATTIDSADVLPFYEVVKDGAEIALVVAVIYLIFLLFQLADKFGGSGGMKLPAGFGKGNAESRFEESVSRREAAKESNDANQVAEGGKRDKKGEGT